MKPLNQHPEREISPATVRNFWHAYSREWRLNRGILFINLWTDATRLLPVCKKEYGVTWWELETTADRMVNITRFYWLRFGIAYVRATYR